MKAIPKLLALTFCASVFTVSAAPPKIESVEPKDGVFVTYGLGHSTVLELKDKRFRYWFTSDRIRLEKVEYPLKGDFTTVGDSIVLEYRKGTPLQSNWTFRAVNGVVTLWRPDALKMSEADKLDLVRMGDESFFHTGSGSVLVPCMKSAEEAWESPQYAVLNESEHKTLTEKQNKKKQNKAEMATPRKPSD
ncbi:MAG: hypothetical protein ACSHX7_14145 [Luteolibacter sp.]